jgi:hypothetical protein
VVGSVDAAGLTSFALRKEVALMKRIILVVTVALLMTLFAGVANAQAPQSPVGGPGSHPHHVHTGNGGCVNIDSVLFEPDVRGLHRGSDESGLTQGPFHGACPHPH